MLQLIGTTIAAIAFIGLVVLTHAASGPMTANLAAADETPAIAAAQSPDGH